MFSAALSFKPPILFYVHSLKNWRHRLKYLFLIVRKPRPHGPLQANLLPALDEAAAGLFSSTTVYLFEMLVNVAVSRLVLSCLTFKNSSFIYQY